MEGLIAIPIVIGAFALGACIGAALIWLATKIVLPAPVAFLNAAVAVLIIFGLNFVVEVVINAAFGPDNMTGAFVSLPISIAVTIAVFAEYLKHPETNEKLGWGKGALVFLVYFGLALAIGLVIFLLFLVIGGAASMGP